MEIFDIIDNICVMHSEELKETHKAHPEFASTWNSHVILRFLSLTKRFDDITRIEPVLEKVDSPATLYDVLFSVFSTGVRCSKPVYQKSPFRR